MTRQKSFKTRIRNRMEKTGESYTTARHRLLNKSNNAETKQPESPSSTPITDRRMSDDPLKARTGRVWDEWFALLDEWGAVDRKHADIADWIVTEHGIDGWWAQTVTVGYEQARGLRVPGQKSDGSFAASGSKTVNVPAERLFEAFADESLREQWLPGVTIQVRTATAPKSFRADWADGTTRIAAFFTPKGDAKSQVGVQHEKLPDGDAAAEMKAYWRERLAVLKQVLET